MTSDYQVALAFTGTGGTWFLNDVNPILALVCGLLTLTHVCIALYKQNKPQPKKKKKEKKRRRPQL
jgi:hypothetical protein